MPDRFTFRVPDPVRPGRTYLTRYKLTIEEAAERFPGAVPEGPGEPQPVGNPDVTHGAASEIVRLGGSGHDRWKG